MKHNVSIVRIVGIVGIVGIVVTLMLFNVACSKIASDNPPIITSPQVGQFVINPQFDEARQFHGGLAAVCVRDGATAMWGFIDQHGKGSGA